MNAGVTQGSLLRGLLVLIYINNFRNGLQCNPKHFADTTSLFSIVHDIATSIVSLKRDLSKRCESEVQWKMNFNPGPCKQPQEKVTI